MNIFLGEIRLFPWNWPPRTWALCTGSLLPIGQNSALFSLLGTTYGGNGQTTFALPNIRGRVPLHFGSSFILGQAGGEASHTLIQSEMPAHTHFLQAGKVAATTATLNGGLLSEAPGGIYGNFANSVAILPSTITNVGGSQPHENRQPYLVLNFIIALQGIFPSRN